MIHPGTWGDTAVAPLSSRSGHRKKKDPTSVGAWPALFIGPLMLGIAVFYYWPIFENVVASLKQTNAFGGNPQFVGFENYRELFASPDLRSATVSYTHLTLPTNREV